ncbi:MAG TPA: hypothetical protein VJ725_08090 [Thermoanaerobaculia bacterium]|nr:hypothetical protein [Thermoanaerobaculia bacterium]
MRVSSITTGMMNTSSGAIPRAKSSASFHSRQKYRRRFSSATAWREITGRNSEHRSMPRLMLRAQSSPICKGLLVEPHLEAGDAQTLGQPVCGF